jgi:NADH-quinone oxidoreductase subunit G
MASSQLFAAVPFYAGLTLDELGGRGVRWPEVNPQWSDWEPARVEVPPAAAAARDGSLRLGRFRSLWADKTVDASPLLHFLRAQQVVELSPDDARALGIREGERVEVGSNGSRVQGAVKLRAAVPAGSVFVAEGVHGQPANRLTDALVTVRRMEVT